MNTIVLRPFAAVKLLTFAAFALVSACHLAGLRGNGNVITENRAIANFTEVDATGAFEIQWSSGPSALSIKTDENLLPYVTTSVTGNKLLIRSREPLRPTHGMKVTLSSPAMSGARLTGGLPPDGSESFRQGFLSRCHWRHARECGWKCERVAREHDGREPARRRFAANTNGGVIDLRCGPRGCGGEHDAEDRDFRRRQSDLFRQPNDRKTNQRRGERKEAGMTIGGTP